MRPRVEATSMAPVVNQSRPAAHAYRASTGTTAITGGVWTTVTFDTESFDTDNMVTIASTPTRITFNTAGTYDIKGGAYFAGTASAITIGARIIKNGSTTNAYGFHYESVPAKGAADNDHVAVSTTIQVVAGDYVELQIVCNLGHNYIGQPSTGVTFLSAEWTGGTGTAWGNAACYVYGPTPTTIAGTGADTPITAFSSEDIDTDNMHSAVTNTDRITCNTPGTYQVMAGMRIGTSTASTQMYVHLMHKNSAGTLLHEWYESKKEAAAAWTFDTECTITRHVQMAAGDYLTMSVSQGSGSTLTMVTSAQGTFMSAVRIGYQSNPSSLYEEIDRRSMANTPAGTADFMILPDGTGSSTSPLKGCTYIDPTRYGGSSNSLVVKLKGSVVTGTSPTSSTVTFSLKKVTAFSAGTVSTATVLTTAAVAAVTGANLQFDTPESALVTLTSAGWYYITATHSVNPAQTLSYSVELLGKPS